MSNPISTALVLASRMIVSSLNPRYISDDDLGQISYTLERMGFARRDDLRAADQTLRHQELIPTLSNIVEDTYKSIAWVFSSKLETFSGAPQGVDQAFRLEESSRLLRGLLGVLNESGLGYLKPEELKSLRSAIESLRLSCWELSRGRNCLLAAKHLMLSRFAVSPFLPKVLKESEDPMHEDEDEGYIPPF